MPGGVPGSGNWTVKNRDKQCHHGGGEVRIAFAGGNSPGVAADEGPPATGQFGREN